NNSLKSLFSSMALPAQNLHGFKPLFRCPGQPVLYVVRPGGRIVERALRDDLIHSTFHGTKKAGGVRWPAAAGPPRLHTTGSLRRGSHEGAGAPVHKPGRHNGGNS